MRKSVAGVLLVLVVVAVFWPALGGEFAMWDDHDTLHLNPRMRAPSWSSVGYYWTHQQEGLYVPMTYTAWSGIAAIAQREAPDSLGGWLRPGPFKAFNVGVHAGAVVLVYLILGRLLSGTEASTGRQQLGALAGAMLFAVHPVQVEAVAWTSGTKDLLCGGFSLLAIWQYLLYAQSAQSGSPRRWHYVGGLLAVALAMLSKPTAMVTPAIVLAIDVLLVRRSVKSSLKALWPWFVLSLGCAVVAKLAQPAEWVYRPPLWARPMIAMDALAFYLYKLGWPVGLCVDHGRRPDVVMGQWWIWATWLVPAGVGLGLWTWRRQWPMGLAAGAVFVLGLAPLLGLVTFLFQFLSTVAEHYLYLPMLGVAMAGGWLAMRLPQRFGRMACVGVLGVLSLMSFRQCGVWQDSYSLFAHAITVNPGSSASYNNIATLLSHEAGLMHARGQSAEARAALQLAEAHLLKAVEIKPDYSTAYINLARTARKLGRADDEVAYLGRAIEIESGRNKSDWDLPALRTQLAHLMLRRGRVAEAQEQLRIVLGQDPTHRGALQLMSAAQIE